VYLRELQYFGRFNVMRELLPLATCNCVAVQHGGIKQTFQRRFVFFDCLIVEAINCLVITPALFTNPCKIALYLVDGQFSPITIPSEHAIVVIGAKCSVWLLQEFVKQARENSAQYRQKIVEWEKRVIAEGHPELVRRVHIKKTSPAGARVSAVKPKAKPAAKRGRPKAAAATAAKRKTQVKNASTQTSAAGKTTLPKSTASRKKKLTVEE